MRCNFLRTLALLLAGSLCVACQPTEQAPTSRPGSKTTAGEGSKPAAKPAPAAETPAEPKTEKEPAPAEKEQSAAGAKSSRVVLGDASLTAGIPGDGALTKADIEAWLANPANHEPLEVELPMGLAAASAQVNIPKDNPLTRAKIELGRQLYFDTRLSKDNTVSCASCHHPDEGYGRHTQFGVGIANQMGGRNSPVSYNRILSGKQFWDGRADSLETQAKGPIQNPIEMGNTHEQAVATIKGIEGYAMQFAKIFSDGVTIDNVAKAIASFERAIVTGPAPYDYDEPLQKFVAVNADELQDLEKLKKEDPELFEKYSALKKGSDDHPFNESARRGKELFFSDRVGCTACHAGANFADEQYHNLGVGMEKEAPDVGRFDQTKNEADRGAFKTPTLRNVTMSAPYMHDGSQKTLEEVVEWYDKGGHPNPQLSAKVKKIGLNEQERKDLVEFMKALTGEFPKVRGDRLP